MGTWSASLLAIALAAGAANAGGRDPQTRCHVAKTKLAGEFVACVQKEEVRRLLTGSPDPKCNVIAFLQRWTAIEQRFDGACAVEQNDALAALFGATEYWRQTSLAIHPASKIVLYDGGASQTGDLFPILPPPEPHRFSCVAAAAALDLECTAIRPLIYQDDPVWSLFSQVAPGQRPIVSVSGVQIADDTQDFLDGDWDACLQSSPGPDCAVGAGVLPDGATWWHGFLSDGMGAEANCSNWHLAFPVLQATIGTASADGQSGGASPWGDSENRAFCDGSNLPDPAHVVCACGQR
jgi:hypothetical protein